MSENKLFEEPRSISGLSLDDIIREYAFWNERIREAYLELNAYKGALIEYAASVERTGQNTVHLETSDARTKVKVAFKKRWKVTDNEHLESVVNSELLTEAKFRELFRIEYEPALQKFKQWLNTASGDERAETAKTIIREAVVEVDALPSLTVEKS